MPDPINPVTAGDTVLLSRETFGKIAGILNWIVKLGVTPPLMMQDGAQGPIISIASQSNFLFPVQVEKDGGSQGDDTTAASWTYTVKDLGGGDIDTEVALTRPRPNGTAVFQVGTFAGEDAGYGTGFYDTDGDFVLWDAGETYATPPTGVQDVRYDITSHKLQETYGNDIWTDIVEFDPCPS